MLISFSLTGFGTTSSSDNTFLGGAVRAYHLAELNIFYLLDDNNPKPACRLNFSGKNNYITLSGDAKAEIRQDIQSLNDIFSHADQLQKTVELYARKAVAE